MMVGIKMFNNTMKRLLILIFVASILTACYDDYRVDYSHTTVAFTTADGGSGDPDTMWRTVVKDEGLNLDFGVYLAGVIENICQVDVYQHPAWAKLSTQVTHYAPPHVD